MLVKGSTIFSKEYLEVSTHHSVNYLEILKNEQSYQVLRINQS